MSTLLRATDSGDPRQLLKAALGELGRVIVGKEHELKLALTCLLARGHLLIEDLPGVGKTTLARGLAQVLGLDYQRVQFTSDMLPADVIGVSLYRPETSDFVFHRGPVFSHLVLADEINRATPKAQSALLEAMEERQVTAEGQCYALPDPFFVIATRNPSSQIGVFPLPESQLDRFLMQISLGFPAAEHERKLLLHGDRRAMLSDIEAPMALATLLELQRQVDAITVAPALLDYLQALLEFTRASGHFETGLSPRGGMALVRAARAWALLEGRNEVIPEDVQAVLPSVVSHRLQGATESTAQRDIGALIIQTVAIP